MERQDTTAARGEDIPLSASADVEGLQRSMNMNHYATKKSAAQSMLDIALLMANSSQLRTVLHEGSAYRYYYPLLFLISMSMFLQVMVGLLLVFIVKYDLNDVKKQPKLNRLNNAATVLVFFTVLVNIFITALGVESGRIVLMAHAPSSDPLPKDTNLTHLDSI